VPAKYYQQVGQAGFTQKPIGAGPYKLVAQEPGNRLEFEAFDGYYRPVHVKKFTIISVPDPATRVAMLEREEADIIYFVPGELAVRVQQNSKVILARWSPAIGGSHFPVSRTRKIRSTTSASARRSASRSTAMR
jgi:ABC-type transport system substrate-binding protein